MVSFTIIYAHHPLRELAIHKSASLSALSNISGVGEKKMECYGTIFLEAISRHLSAPAL